LPLATRLAWFARFTLTFRGTRLLFLLARFACFTRRTRLARLTLLGLLTARLTFAARLTIALTRLLPALATLAAVFRTFASRLAATTAAGWCRLDGSSRCGGAFDPAEPAENAVDDA